MGFFDRQFKSKIHLFFVHSQRIAKTQWWLKLRPLLRILAKHDSAYEEEGMYITVEEGLEADTLLV